MHDTTRQQYDHFRANPPIGRGNGASAAYWRGANGIRCLYARDSLAYAAWKAGRDNAKASG